MLHDVFAECERVLEPGGRIAVNVANLGRQPYRSLSADVTPILQDRLGLLLRGEVVWWKGGAPAASARGAPSSARRTRCCATSPNGSSIASKGRLRPGDDPGQRAWSGPALHRHHHARRVHGGHPRPVGDPARERHPRRSPGPVPGRAPPAPDRALHLRGRRRPRSVHGLGQHGRRGRPHRAALHRVRHRSRRTSRSRRSGRAERGRTVASRPSPSRWSTATASAASTCACAAIEAAGFTVADPREVTEAPTRPRPRVRAHSCHRPHRGRVALRRPAASPSAARPAPHRLLWRSLGEAGVLHARTRRCGSRAHHRPPAASVGPRATRPSPTPAVPPSSTRRAPASTAEAIGRTRPRPGRAVDRSLHPVRTDAPCSRHDRDHRDRSPASACSAVATSADLAADAGARRSRGVRRRDVGRRLRRRRSPAGLRRRLGQRAAFLESPDGLRGRRAAPVEWKGPHQHAGCDILPVDLRVDHVFLVSCKYLSHILGERSPAHLFVRRLADRTAGADPTLVPTCAPDEYQHFSDCVRRFVGRRALPAIPEAPPPRRPSAEQLAGTWPGHAPGRVRATL